MVNRAETRRRVYEISNPFSAVHDCLARPDRHCILSRDKNRLRSPRKFLAIQNLLLGESGDRKPPVGRSRERGGRQRISKKGLDRGSLRRGCIHFGGCLHLLTTPPPTPFSPRL